MAGWSVCVEHRGRHGTLDGACIGVGRAVPRPYSYRFGSCQECGAALDVRLDNRTGRVERLEAGTEREHVHAPPRRVELDPDELASAIVSAAAAARQQRASERRDDAPADPWQPPRRPAEKPPLGGVPVLTDADG